MWHNSRRRAQLNVRDASFNNAQKPNLSTESPKKLDIELLGLHQCLLDCRDESIRPSIEHDISLKERMIAERDDLLQRVLPGEQMWRIDGCGRCWYKATSQGLSASSNLELHDTFEEIIAKIIIVLRRIALESTMSNLRGHAESLAQTVEKNSQDYAGNDELIQIATSIAINHELELISQGGAGTVYFPAASAIHVGLSPPLDPPKGRLKFAHFEIGCHHFDCITKKKPESGDTPGKNDSKKRPSSDPKERPAFRARAPVGRRVNSFSPFESDGEYSDSEFQESASSRENSSKHGNSMSTETASRGVASAGFDSDGRHSDSEESGSDGEAGKPESGVKVSESDETSIWRAMRLVVQEGGAVELRSISRSVLGSVYIPLETPERDAIFTSQAMTACLAAALEEAGPIIEQLATRLPRNKLTDSQCNSSFVARHIVPLLARVIGLGLRWGLGDGGLIPFLAIQYGCTTEVFEPDGVLGLGSTYSAACHQEKCMSIPLFHPHLGSCMELDDALKLKSKPKGRTVVRAVIAVINALEKLPPGFSYAVVLLPGKSEPWKKANLFPADGGGDGVLVLSRGASFSNFAISYNPMLSAHVRCTSECYLLQCLLGLRVGAGIDHFMLLCSLGPSVLHEVLAAYRDQLQLLTSASRERGLRRRDWEAIAAVTYESIFNTPPEKLRTQSPDGKRKRDPTFHGLEASSVPLMDAEENSDPYTSPFVSTIPVFQFGPSMLILPASVQALFASYHAAAVQSAVCINRFETCHPNGSTVLKATIALPRYNQRQLIATKQAPALVKVTCVSDNAGQTVVTFDCNCELQRLAKAAVSLTVRGAEGKMCWMERFLRNPETFENIIFQCHPGRGLSAADPITSDILLNRPQGFTHEVQKYAYVSVSMAVDRTLLGNSKDSIVTVSRDRMRCHICHGGRRHESKDTSLSSCPHIKHLLEVIKKPDTDDRRCIRDVYEDPNAAPTSSESPSFNKMTQEFVFRSLSRDIEDRSLLPVCPMETINVNSPDPSSYMGGSNDLAQIRLTALLQFSLRRDDPVKAVVDNGLAKRMCIDCTLPMSTVAAADSCAHCTADISYQCVACALVVCSKCSVVELEDKFYAAFTRTGQQPLNADQIQLFTASDIAKMLKIAEQDYVDQQPLTLKPNMPVGLSCSFDAHKFMSVGFSTLYLPTHKVPIEVFNRVCDLGCCTIEPTGSEMRCHRQSKDTIIHLDLIHFFHFSMRTMRGPGITAFTGLVNELYAANGAGEFMGADLFARCYYGAKCRELRGKTLGRPCFTCPKRLVNGVWATQCKIIAVDAKMDIKIARHLLQKRTVQAPDMSVPEAPTVNCKKRSHLDRLFFSGDSKTNNSMYRTFISAICNSILGVKLDTVQRTLLEDHEGAFLQFKGDATVKCYVGSFDMVYEGYLALVSGHGPSDLVSKLARWFLAITNTQCPMDQFLSSRACDFIESSLKLSLDGELSFTITRDAEKSGVRRQLVKLFEAVFLGPIEPATVRHPESQGFGSVQYRVSSMLLGMCAAARAAFAQCDSQPALQDLKKPLPADYSSGVAMFVTKGGGMLRLYPKFTNVGKSGRQNSRSCTKPSWQQSECKKWQWSSDGNVTLMCATSGCCLGTFFLDAAEGRSSASAAIYSFFPDWDEDMTVVCDTPCMHSIYVGNRLPRYFKRWQWICDRFHLPPHTCKLIFNPDDFEFLDGLNLSLIEQWHAIVDGLSVSVQRMNLDHAMFFILLLQHDRYDELADRASVPPSERCWPEDPVSSESNVDTESEVEKSDMALEVTGDVSDADAADESSDEFIALRVDTGSELSEDSDFSDCGDS